MRPGLQPIGWLVVAALAAACAPEERETRMLELTQVRPKVLDDVYLNEPLVFHFSAELERASVNDQSVRITTRDGLAARGERRVEGKQLRFLPDPVRQPDLSDGGFAPGTAYVVRLAGFPRVDGLRDVSGAPLGESLELEFRTVSVADEGQSGFVFYDRTPDRAEPLRMAAGRRGPGGERIIGPLDPIEFEGEEPLDPSTLFAEDFSLQRLGPGGIPAELVPLRAVLRENHDKGLWPPRGTTRMQLLPAMVLEPGRYVLRIRPNGNRLSDFGRNRVPVVGESGRPQSRFSIEVAPGPTPIEASHEHVEDFVDASMRSHGVVAGADGSALWAGTGRVELRFPAAAGDGADGDLVPTEPIRSDDLHATRFEIPGGHRVEIETASGLAVIRSQGSLVVTGSLVRTQEAAPLEFDETMSLSAWLDLARESGVTCTVLIAGGDLVVSGEIQLNGPLLLVAGGRLRLLPSGRIRVGDQIPLLPGDFVHHGDTGAVAVWTGGEDPLAPRAVPLSLDPPVTNPLRTTLRFSTLSRRLPRSGEVYRWLPSPRVLGHRGGGRFSVLYVGERADGFQEITREDPALLVDCPTLRLLIELEMEPDAGGPWDPPWLDSVALRWDDSP